MRQAILRAWLLLFAIFILGFACGKAMAAETYALVTWSHTSDLLRGPPFNNEDEPAQEFLGAGVTIVMGKEKRFEIDITHGFKRISRRDENKPRDWETGSEVRVRWYPGRKLR